MGVSLDNGGRGVGLFEMVWKKADWRCLSLVYRDPVRILSLGLWSASSLV